MYVELTHCVHTEVNKIIFYFVILVSDFNRYYMEINISTIVVASSNSSLLIFIAFTEQLKSNKTPTYQYLSKSGG